MILKGKSNVGGYAVARHPHTPVSVPMATGFSISMAPRMSVPASAYGLAPRAMHMSVPMANNISAPAAAYSLAPRGMNISVPSTAYSLAPRGMNISASSTANITVPSTAYNLAPRAMIRSVPPAANVSASGANYNLAPSAMNRSVPPAANVSVPGATYTLAPRGINRSVPTAANASVSGATYTLAPRGMIRSVPPAANVSVPGTTYNLAPRAMNRPVPPAANVSVPGATYNLSPRAMNRPVPPAANVSVPGATYTLAPRAMNRPVPPAANVSVPGAAYNLAPRAMNTSVCSGSNIIVHRATHNVVPRATNISNPRAPTISIPMSTMSFQRPRMPNMSHPTATNILVQRATLNPSVGGNSVSNFSTPMGPLISVPRTVNISIPSSNSISVPMATSILVPHAANVLSPREPIQVYSKPSVQMAVSTATNISVPRAPVEVQTPVSSATSPLVPRPQSQIPVSLVTSNSVPVTQASVPLATDISVPVAQTISILKMGHEDKLVDSDASFNDDQDEPNKTRQSTPDAIVPLDQAQRVVTDDIINVTYQSGIDMTVSDADEPEILIAQKIDNLTEVFQKVRSDQNVECFEEGGIENQTGQQNDDILDKITDVVEGTPIEPQIQTAPHFEKSGESSEIGQEKSGESSEIGQEKSGESSEIRQEKSSESSEIGQEKSSETSGIGHEKSGESSEIGQEKSSESSEIGHEQSGENSEIGQEKSGESSEIGKEKSGKSSEIGPEKVHKESLEELGPYKDANFEPFDNFNQELPAVKGTTLISLEAELVSKTLEKDSNGEKIPDESKNIITDNQGIGEETDNANNESLERCIEMTVLDSSDVNNAESQKENETDTVIMNTSDNQVSESFNTGPVIKESLDRGEHLEDKVPERFNTVPVTEESLDRGEQLEDLVSERFNKGPVLEESLDRGEHLNDKVPESFNLVPVFEESLDRGEQLEDKVSDSFNTGPVLEESLDIGELLEDQVSESFNTGPVIEKSLDRGEHLDNQTSESFSTGPVIEKSLNRDEHLDNQVPEDLITEPVDDPVNFEITENSDSDNETSGTENLLITNVMSLSECMPKVDEGTDENVRDGLNETAEITDDKVRESEGETSEKSIVSKVDDGSYRRDELPDKPASDPIQKSVQSSNNESPLKFKPRNRRRRKRDSVSVRKALDRMKGKNLEDMFVPITRVVRQSDQLIEDSTTNEKDTVIAMDQIEIDLAGDPLPVISNTFTMQDNNDMEIPPVSIKSEGPDNGDYSAAEPTNGKSVNTTSATQVYTEMLPPYTPLHVAKKTLASNVTPAPTFFMARVGGMAGTGVRFLRYAIQPMTSLPTSQGVSLLPGSTVTATSTTTAITASATSATSTAAPETATVTQTIQNKGSEMNDILARYETINIQSVGVGLITDLIARKNPIATYKAPSVPDNIKNAQNSKVHPCYECGDTFHLRKSFDIHIGRCSMKISYKCEKCSRVLKFTNKCQLLNHLRSHLNIHITQAVPIHIKSDSIEITSYFEEIVNSQGDFQWYKVNDKVSQCPVCHIFEYTEDEELKRHFRGNDKGEPLKCDQCMLQMRSHCAFTAHQKIHELCAVFRTQNISALSESKIVGELVCPECGTTPKGASVWIKVNLFMQHALHVCHHFSLLNKSSIQCTACSHMPTNDAKMSHHLNEKLEHYYKCEKCPMALKSLKNLEAHFQLKHKQERQVLAKVIYRCHVCSTVIDDRSYLLEHLKSHLLLFQRKSFTEVHCHGCGLLAISLEGLQAHYKKEHHVEESCRHIQKFTRCVLCRKSMQNAIMLVDHLLEQHLNKPSTSTKVIFCDYCGLLCADDAAFRKHPCLGKLKKWQVVGDLDVENQRCNICSIPFRNSAHKTIHLNYHQKNDVLRCYICKKRGFSSPFELKSHSILCSAMKDQRARERKSDNCGTVERKGKEELEREKKRDDEDSDLEVKLTPVPTKDIARRPDKKTVFTCDKCPSYFTRKAYLDKHINAEHGLHPCHLCGEMHNSSFSLKRHLLIDHEGKRLVYFCRICRKRKIEKSYSLASKLAKHLKLKHRMKNVDESEFVAELPGFPGLSEKELTPEIQKGTLPETSTEPAAKKIKTEEDARLEFKCSKCLFSCEVKSDFLIHIIMHRTPNTFQCLECGLCFSVFPSLKKHLFMVHKVRDFNKYIEENQIENPADSIDSDDDIEREPQRTKQSSASETEEEVGNPLECKVCYKEFDTEQSLKCHMRIHGMAFIKKSRRRSQGVGPNKKVKIETEEERQCEMVGKGASSLKMKIVKSKLVKSSDEDGSSPEKSATEKKSEGDKAVESADTQETERVIADDGNDNDTVKQ